MSIWSVRIDRDSWSSTKAATTVFAPLANVSLKKTKWSTYSCFVSSEVEITIWELAEKATGKSYNKRYISNRNAEG